jgi:hypothetical protein
MLRYTKLSVAIFEKFSYRRNLLINQKIAAMIKTTIIIPVHIPTLNIPSIASQELTETKRKARTGNNRLFLIFIRFMAVMQKPYPR